MTTMRYAGAIIGRHPCARLKVYLRLSSGGKPACRGALFGLPRLGWDGESGRGDFERRVVERWDVGPMSAPRFSFRSNRYAPPRFWRSINRRFGVGGG